MLDANTRNQNTKAIITGGAQGIGFAIARQLAAEGCRSIAVAGRTAEKGARAVEQLKALGVDAVFEQADVIKVEDCRRIVAVAIDRFGTINGLVNAAATSARGSLIETTPELFDLIFNTNVRGPFLLMQSVVRRLLETNTPGSIVNILSMSAHAGQSFLTPIHPRKGPWRP
jgi:NAD(P)-dependent dehydrogenase (short-subunit alcohol dehydrogenase family)